VTVRNGQALGKNTSRNGRVDFGVFLAAQIIPQLTLESIFTDPSHRFKHAGDKSRGGCPWHESKSGTSFVVDRNTLQWWCAGCNVGGGPIQYLWKLTGGVGVTPRGRDFIEQLRGLAVKAGVPFPEMELTEADKEQARRLETRRAVLASAVALCERALSGTHGAAAREYLAGRGFTEPELQELRVGWYPLARFLAEYLEKAGHTPEDIKESRILFEGLVGYTTWPWHDDTGALLTIYGKWPNKAPPGGKPKTTALPNPKDAAEKDWLHTKQSPMYLDRALAAGHRDLILVEGPTDAALPQLRGDSRVVACVAAQLSGDQVETLRHRGVRSMTIALDPDKAGDNGIGSCVRQLEGAGIRAYVAPRLPNGLDPDEFILRDGIDEWKKHVANPTHGYRHLAGALIASHGVRESGDDLWLDDLIDKAVAFADKQPAEADADMLLHFWPAVAEATGATMEALAARVKPKSAAVPPSEDAAPAGAAALAVIDSPTFAATDYPLHWHVKKVLVRGQPAIVAGPKKCLKTSLLCDFAVSIGSGQPFLGVFQSEGPTRIGFFSGESGPHAIKATARLVCAARGIRLEDAGVWWCFAVPQLSRAEQLACLAEQIGKHQLQVVIIDPLYLCLLAGNPDVRSSNLYDMGPLLAAITEVCRQAGADVILCHHFIKRPADPFGVPELEDMSGAGVAEFARQWVLIGRRERYEPGTGLHKLWLNVGGSAGFSSCWSVDVDEGVLADDFSGKKWEATVEGAAAAILGKKVQAETKREEQQASRRKDDETKVLQAIDYLTAAGQPYSSTRVRDKAVLNGDKFRQAVERLVAEGLIERCDVKVPTAKGAMKPAESLKRVRRAADASSGSSGQAG